MESLRLLTRGSSLKFPAKPERKISPVPSAGAIQNSSTADNNSSKKRKRSDVEEESRPDDGNSAEEIRKSHHQNRIKITDLNALHAHSTAESRKAQKQSSRLYPPLLHRFASLSDQHANPALLANLAKEGYREPTEVQMATIPLLMDERNEPDLLTIAPTGSGKTLAFMVPLIEKITRTHKSHSDDVSIRQVSVVVLAPTKELVAQIVNEGRKLAARTGVRITAFKKGMRLHEHLVETHDEDDDEGDDDSERDTPAQAGLVKSDILVTTPLTLLNAISPKQSTAENTSDRGEPIPLPHITNLVLDEADILLDTLFRDQTLSIWSAFTNPSLRTSFWSATIGSNIEEIVMSILQTRHASLPKAPLLVRVIIGLKDTSLPNIRHKLIFSSTEQGKLTGLRNLIRPPPGSHPIIRPPFLIFTQTIPRAESLLNEIKYDIPPSTLPDAPARIAILHSSLSATQRARIMTNFRLGKIWILIATDLLSRGIDFRGVNGVVNYDIPTTPASYVHRAGRTGRAGRAGGVCVTFYTKDDVPYLRPIANVIRKSQDVHGGGRRDGNGDESGIPDWLLNSLPALTKEVKKDLKQRGVDVRRAVKESDDKHERRRKGRNVIGTQSGYDKKLENNRRSMIEASKRRKRRESHGEEHQDADEFDGFD